MPANWNAETDRRLLIAVITALSPSPPKWDIVASLMGSDFTAEALRQRYQKLKKIASTELGNPNDPTTPTPKKASPRKRTTPKAKGAENGTNGFGQVEDDEESPSKKPKIKTDDSD